MKTILGLDLGTNSVGWAVSQLNFEDKKGKILGMGSRIIPIPQDILGKFDAGQSVSQTAERRGFRSIRRLLERDLLRRERLHRVLHLIGFLPPHYAAQIDFEKRLGQFIEGQEPKLAYRTNEEGKVEFIFQKSFEEMLEDFRKHQPELVANNKKIPYDWAIYYLRKKALSEKIEKEELAWILLNFNQKRGYYQLRGEGEDVEETKSVKFYALKVLKVEAADKGKNDEVWYNVYLENGWIYRRSSKTFLEWEGKVKEFIVTENLNTDGSIKTDKDGKEIRSFKAVDSEQDWIAIKKSTEEKITQSNQTVGEYIYGTLLQKPNQKIRGKLIRTIERKFYKDELKKILEKQKEHHTELQDKALYHTCTEELYPYNDAHRNSIANKGFVHLFMEDIIFYQRPLKSKKSLISNCSLEKRLYKKEDGTLGETAIKCIAKSNPLYQEFRLLQWVKNLKIFKKEASQNIDITDELLPTITDREHLFEWLNDKVEINQNTFLKYPEFKLEEKIKAQIGSDAFKIFKKDKEQGLHTYYRWNYVEDKAYPLNETRGKILKTLQKYALPADFINNETEMHLWHILYSVEDKKEIQIALEKYAKKNHLPPAFVEAFEKFPRIDKEYGAFSEKAIKKLLPLMWFGKWWNADGVDEKTQQRIDNILTGEYDEKIKNRVRDKAINLKKIEDFQNLPLWLASYIIYNRHSETSDVRYWKTANDIEQIKQHSLRNPVVEQIINETLQTIKDIWKNYGNGKENFFDEIHVELGREMKNDKKKRENLSKTITENENTNTRIKALLAELLNDSTTENVRPHSPSQQEILKIYEEGVYCNENDVKQLEEIEKIRKKNQPTPAELKRYKLWLEQGYKSPYTGEMIPLSKLFTLTYEIEHIIPQSRFFDDSLSNKVICEAEVNSLKDNQLAFEFIKNNKELEIELSHGKFVRLLSPNAYEENVKRYFAKSAQKMKKLLMEEIPESFIQRQLNDTRYISKVVKTLLSNIVREDGEEEATAKKIIVSSGAITSKLKQDWGLNDVWNELITPRFERLNNMARCEKYGSWENKEGKKIFQINSLEPELQKLNKKRIDHRHHALDALIVACSSRSHINYLNNESASESKKSERLDLRNKLRKIETFTDKDGRQRTTAKEFLKPWDSFTQDAKNELHKIIVSFKKNNRVINKTVNLYQKWEKQSDGSMKKVFVKQTKGDSWAIRKPLHKDTVSGLVNLRNKKEVSFSVALHDAENIVNKSLRNKIKELQSGGFDKKKVTKFFKEQDSKWQGKNIERVEVYFFTNDNEKTKVVASRVKLDESFDDEQIEAITDTGIQKILFAHLEKYKGQVDDKGKPIAPEILAFSADGIDDLNKNLTLLNEGKPHAPIYKVRTHKTLGAKFNVGITGNKKAKFVEAAKGTNLFFAIYADEKGDRSYETVPLSIVIERQKQGLPSCPPEDEKGNRLLFDLSPNDLVYVPTVEEQENPHIVNFENLSKEQVKRIYKPVSFTEKQAFFIQNAIATSVINGFEFSALNKMEKSIDRVMIKSVCWKLQINRLGQIKGVVI